MVPARDELSSAVIPDEAPRQFGMRAALIGVALFSLAITGLIAWTPGFPGHLMLCLCLLLTVRAFLRGGWLMWVVYLAAGVGLTFLFFLLALRAEAAEGNIAISAGLVYLLARQAIFPGIVYGLIGGCVIEGDIIPMFVSFLDMLPEPRAMRACLRYLSPSRTKRNAGGHE